MSGTHGKAHQAAPKGGGADVTLADARRFPGISSDTLLTFLVGFLLPRSHQDKAPPAGRSLMATPPTSKSLLERARDPRDADSWRRFIDLY